MPAEAAREDVASNDSSLMKTGPWMLIVGGVSLVVASFVFRGSSDVASPGVVLGTGMTVVGVLLERLVGPFELSLSGLKGRLAGISNRAKADPTVEPSLRDDVIDLAQADFVAEATKSATSKRDAARIADEAYENAVAEARGFEEKVRQWLVDSGWDVHVADQRLRVDFVCRRGEERMLVEVKMRRGALTVGDLSAAVRALRVAEREYTGAHPNRTASLALVVSAPHISASSLMAATEERLLLFRDSSDGIVPVDLPHGSRVR